MLAELTLEEVEFLTHYRTTDEASRRRLRLFAKTGAELALYMGHPKVDVAPAHCQIVAQYIPKSIQDILWGIEPKTMAEHLISYVKETRKAS